MKPFEGLKGPIPADVYCAARRIYIGSTKDREGDDAIVREWAGRKWPGGIPSDKEKLSFWVMSQSAQDGHEGV